MRPYELEHISSRTYPILSSRPTAATYGCYYTPEPSTVEVYRRKVLLATHAFQADAGETQHHHRYYQHHHVQHSHARRDRFDGSTIRSPQSNKKTNTTSLLWLSPLPGMSDAFQVGPLIRVRMETQPGKQIHCSHKKTY